VLEVKSEKLLGEPQDFSEAFEYEEYEEYGEEELSDKMERFLKKIISSVYTDGVADVTDESGDPPAEHNNFLLSDDGTEFSGIFYGKQGKERKSYPFTISEKNGKWSIRY
jgi:hypothetical protein